jgi:hypothetical protein
MTGALPLSARGRRVVDVAEALVLDEIPRLVLNKNAFDLG